MKESSENNLISRRALYDKCVELEQEALKMVLTTDDKIEKLIWNAILTERSAFKFSVMDAPASLSNPFAYPETIPIEEVSSQLGCATTQSALYWFEFLKTLDLLGFAIVRKETR